MHSDERTRAYQQHVAMEEKARLVSQQGAVLNSPYVGPFPGQLGGLASLGYAYSGESDAEILAHLSVVLEQFDEQHRRQTAAIRRVVEILTEKAKPLTNAADEGL